MEFLRTLFTTPGVASTVVFLCLTGFLGMWLGKLKIFNVKLGVAGVLFSGLLIAHLGAPIDTHVLHFIQEFGLILFVYSIGIDMGPRFFSSFKKDGLTLNLLAVGIVLGGFGIAYLIYLFTDITPSVIVGILSGAVTNTPSLGAAQTMLGELGQSTSETGMAYAMAYPFGVIGIIITMLLVRMFFKVKIDNEVTEYNSSLGGSDTQLQSVEIKVSNPNLFGRDIDYILHLMDGELAVSRIFRANTYIVASGEETLHEGDILYGVSSQQLIDNLQAKIGEVKISEQAEVSGPLAMTSILVTKRNIAGKTIEQVGIYRRYPANITRIFRNGMKILPTLHTTLELGDTVRVVGKKEVLDQVRAELGDSLKELAKPNISTTFLGIFLGIILGSVPIFLPGLPAPAKLGLAGGPLLVAILLGYKGRIGSMNFYMAPGANLFIREMGIILFLSCVGLLSGGKFVETITNGGVQWMLYGMLITFLPILIVSIIARFMKINYLKICGCIAGSMTDPPALEFANSIAPAQAQSTAYATVYPLTMFLRVLLAQIFVLLTL